MSENEKAPEAVVEAPTEELALERGRSKAVFWVILGLAVVAALGFVITSSIGGSVLYYKTPSEVVAAHDGQPVRLAGQLVKDSVNDKQDGAITFKVTDGKTTVAVIYHGGATTALTTAAKPGTQMVAEGTLGKDNVFEATNLLAKCPSKFQNATPSATPQS
jgi:cytochrome c-type biogenesis protein CcmE